MRQAVLFAALLAALPFAGAAEDAAKPGAFDPAAVAAQMWKEKLGLSAEQAEKLAAAAKAKDDASATLRAQLRADLRKIRTQVAAKSSDKDIQASLDQVASANEGLRAEEQKYDAALRKFLSPTQRAQILVGMPFARKADAADLTEATTDGDGEPE